MDGDGRKQMENEKQLALENRKLSREIKRLKKDNEMLRIANEQASRTQAYIQKQNSRQMFYISQLLKTSPYLEILTDEQMITVMTSDAYYRFSSISKEKIWQGVPVREALAEFLEAEALEKLIDKCERVLAQKPVNPYFLQSSVHGERIDWRITINPMLMDGQVAGLNIMFMDETDIVNALERARAADKAKSNFVSNMSHEIRTPMNAINGMAEFILRDSRDEEARQHAAAIKSASNSLLAIINDILDFSKIENGKMEIIETPCSLSSLVNDVATMIQFRLQNNTVELRLDIDSNLPSLIYADEVRLKQVLINLLGNAVKFTPRGSITWKMFCEPVDAVQCRLFTEIRDTGIGIKEQDLEKIFSSFTQVDTKRNRSVEGTGLGLAISRRIVEMMGGKIRVESVYGEGTAFSYDIVCKVKDWRPIGRIEGKRGKHTVKPFSVTASAEGAKVLVVDDNAMNLAVTSGILRPYGITVTAVACGMDAIDAFLREEYDIIFMDHMMPVMDGVETMQKIRKLPGGDKAVIIALTANVFSGATEEYKAQGFQDFLAKPIEPQKMDEILKTHLKPSLIRLVDSSNNWPEKSSLEGNRIRGLQPGAALPLRAQEDLETGGISTEKGLHYCGGNWDLYKDLLYRFVLDASGRRNEMQRFFESGDFKNYAILAHALKSTSGTIGADVLSELARELEMAAKENRTHFIAANHAEMITRYIETEQCVAAACGDNFPIAEDKKGDEDEDVLEFFPEVHS
jgi:signal transduction histidine kinase/DNA-binding NarL/FixJ family response regulator